MVRVVVVELTVLDVLGDAVDLVLRLMDSNLGVRYGDHVDFAIGRFLLKQRSLPDADANVHLGTAHVVKSWFHFSTLLLNQQIEVHIDITSECSVLSIPVGLRLLLLLIVAASLCPGGLHLLDIVHNIARGRLVVLLHSAGVTSNNTVVDRNEIASETTYLLS